MKLFIAAFYCLMTLVVSDPGILLVRFGDKQEQPFCISFHGGDVQLPDSFSEADFNPLVDTSPDTLCDVPADISHLSGSVLMVPGFNCSVTKRAIIAEELDAAGMVVVIEDGLTYGNDTFNISVVMMAGDDYTLFGELHKQHVGEDVTAVLFSPEVPLYDPNLFFICILAVSIVAVGGYWSGLMTFKKYKRKTRERRNSGGGSTVDGEEYETDEDGDDDDSVDISIKVIFIWVAMIITFLLLLFFFYNIFVYVVIFMFCLGAWSSLYVCLHPFVIRVFRSKSSTPVIPLLKARYTYVGLILAAFCLVPVVCWFVFRKEDFAWILQDILGAVFCISMLKIIHLPDFKMCVLLLGLLFVYDLFFVFITPLLSKDGESVMLKVATGGDDATEKLPILFMFPSFSSSYYKYCKGFSLLGFGDVLIPGLLVGFCHGFDMKIRSMKIYFIGSTAAYLLGISLTFIALIIMSTGQPALVYIVPSMLTTVVLIGWFRGELRALWTGRPTKCHVPLGGAVNASIST